MLGATPSAFVGQDDGKSSSSEYFGMIDADEKYFEISQLVGFKECTIVQRNDHFRLFKLIA